MQHSIWQFIFLFQNDERIRIRFAKVLICENKHIEQWNITLKICKTDSERSRFKKKSKNKRRTHENQCNEEKKLLICEESIWKTLLTRWLLYDMLKQRTLADSSQRQKPTQQWFHESHQNLCWLPYQNARMRKSVKLYVKNLSQNKINESRTSNRDVEKKQFVEKQIFWTQLLWFLQVLFSWILHIRHARLFDWYIWSTWRMKECVHWVIQMKCKNNDCTDVRFTMYRIQEKEKYYAIRTDNRQCRRKSDLYCEQFHLRHWLMRKIRAWLLKFILPRICNQMMTEENQAYW